MNTEKKENKLEIYVIPPVVPDSKATNIKVKWWHIDKEMVRFKVHYFVFMGALGSSMPFFGIFAKYRIGLSATSFAAILTILQFLFIFTKNLVGYLADYFNKLKVVIGVMTVLPTIFLFLLLATPKINNYQTAENPDLKSFKPEFDANQNKSCKLFQESIVFARTKLDANVFCSTASSNLQKIKQECLLTVIFQSSRTYFHTDGNSTNVNQEMSLLDDNEHTNTSYTDSICANCCNITENCIILMCPENEEDSQIEYIELNQFKTYQFWEFAFFLIIVQASFNALFSLSDTACCETVTKTGSDLGRQRLYGAVSWGLTAPLAGLLNDSSDGYLPGFIITGVLLILSLWNLWKLDLVQPQYSQNILKDVGTVMGSKEFLTFQFGVFTSGVSAGIIWSYQMWFLTSIGGNRLLCGLVETVQCFVGEIPFMFFSGWFVKKMGYFNVLNMALLAFCVRFLWYSYLENPWLVLPIETVHGFSYGILYPAVASYAKLKSKPGTEATTQSILFSTHEGLGAGIGCVLAGIGFDNIGGRQTFFYASIFSGCCMLINLTFTWWNRKENKSAVAMS